MKTIPTITSAAVVLAAAGLTLSACGESDTESDQANSAPMQTPSGDTHTHADGSTHADHAEEPGQSEETSMSEDDHAHDEVALDPVTIDGMQIQLAQGHGAIEAGRESHLVVKLPYNDNGQTVVRAWIGTEDRTMSFVGKGEYAPSHNDYDIHAMAPDPLPDNAMWWIEIEKPDGTTVVGSAAPITE